MLNCEFCAYYKVLESASDTPNPKVAICEFSGILFSDDVLNLTTEYPCQDISYSEYLFKPNILIKQKIK